MKNFNGRKMSHNTRTGVGKTVTKPACFICGSRLQMYNGAQRCMTVGAGGKKAIQHGRMNRRKKRLGSEFYSRASA